MTRTIRAIYDGEVFCPLEAVDLEVGTTLTISFENSYPRPTAVDIIKLAADVYEGLTEAEIREVEAHAVDRLGLA
jgi:predicted DNA-binding antitoxin AbrB/MazE fold protein